MNIVDTPGTNVILQRQQRLTEEFVPRADLVLFVISADRPLTESEVWFVYLSMWHIVSFKYTVLEEDMDYNPLVYGFMFVLYKI